MNRNIGDTYLLRHLLTFISGQCDFSCCPLFVCCLILQVHVTLRSEATIRPRIKRHRSQSQRKLNVSVDSCSPFASLMPVLNLLHARTVSLSGLFPARSMFSLSGLTSVRKFALLGLVGVASSTNLAVFIHPLSCPSETLPNMERVK